MSKDEEKKELMKKLWIIISCLFWQMTIFFIFGGFSLFFSKMSNTWLLLGLVVTTLYFYYALYFRLAPNNVLWTFVKEGTAKIVTKNGKVHKILIQYKGKSLDKNWEIIDGKEKHFWGGLRWLGIFPVYQVYVYKLRWTSLEQSGVAVPHEDNLDSVLLKKKVYAMRMEDIEDANRVPLTIDILITLKVINPYSAIFIAEDYLELVLNRIRPLFRQYVGGIPFEELITKKQGANEEIWIALNQDGLIETFKKEFGIEIEDGGIEMQNITPKEEYQKAASQKYLAAREAERVAGETIGAVINMMAVSRGLTAKEMQEKVNNSTKLQKEFREYCKDTLHKKMAIDGNSYVKIDVNGAGGGVEKTLMELAAAWLRMPNGKSAQQEQKKKNRKGEPSREDKMKRLTNFKEKGGKLNLVDDEEE